MYFSYIFYPVRYIHDVPLVCLDYSPARDMEATICLYLFRTFLIFFLFQRLAIIQTACTMPGIYPRSVKRIFSQKAPLNPTWRKTPSGGKSIAIKIRIRSIFILLVFRSAEVSRRTPIQKIRQHRELLLVSNSLLFFLNLPGGGNISAILRTSARSSKGWFNWSLPFICSVIR